MNLKTWHDREVGPFFLGKMADFVGAQVKMKQINHVLKENVLRYNVNKDSLENVNNVPSSKSKALEEFLAEYGDKPEAIARTIAEELGDLENINFHIRAAKNNHPNILFESLSITKDAYRDGLISSTKARYYVGVLKRKGAKW